MLTSFETQHRVLVVMQITRSNVNDIDVLCRPRARNRSCKLPQKTGIDNAVEGSRHDSVLDVKNATNGWIIMVFGEPQWRGMLYLELRGQDM